MHAVRVGSRRNGATGGVAKTSARRTRVDAARLDDPGPKVSRAGIEFRSKNAATFAMLQVRSRAIGGGGLAEIVVTKEQLLESVAGWPRDPKALLAHNLVPVNLSDADGTLWHGNLGAKVITHMGQQGQFKPEIRRHLDHALELMGLEPTGVDQPDRGVNHDMLRMLDGFRAWLKRDTDESDRAACHKLGAEMFGWMFVGHTEASVEKITGEAIDASGMSGKFFEGSAEMIRALADLGIATEVITAGFEAMTRAATTRLGIPRESVHGTRCRLDSDGRITAEVVRVAAGPAKAEVAKSIVSARAKQLGVSSSRLERLRPLMAQGDSPSVNDRALLEYAHIAVVVEPESKADVEVALERGKNGRPVMVLDYARTVDGEAADRFTVPASS